MKILIVVNTMGFFISHRLPIANQAKTYGHDVHVATGTIVKSEEIERLGFTQHYVKMSRSGVNPFAALHTFWFILKLFWTERPDLVHLVTVKPIIYGGIAARLLRVPAMVAAVSGLGTVFIGKSWARGLIRQLVTALYRLALGHSNSRVIFQNPDDLEEFNKNGIADINRSVLIKGSGVSLHEYVACDEPKDSMTVVCVSRLLKDKGIREFVEAARILKPKFPPLRFWLAGAIDPGNISSISKKELSLWREEGIVEVLGHADNIPSLFAKSNVVVLPSYREGFPKVIMEAAACRRAVVTTNVPGCRHAVEHGRTGLIVPACDVLELANAIEWLICNPRERERMGHAGRDLAELEFSVEKIVDAHLRVFNELTQHRFSR